MAWKLAVVLVTWCALCDAPAHAQAEWSLAPQLGAGGAYSITGVFGAELAYTPRSSVALTGRATGVRFAGPCADPDLETNPSMCLASGAAIVAGVRLETPRGLGLFAQPSIGAFWYHDEFRSGEAAPLIEMDAGIRLGNVRLGVRYGHALDDEFERVMDHPMEYLVAVLSVAISLGSGD